MTMTTYWGQSLIWFYLMKHWGKIEGITDRDSQTSLEEDVLGIVITSPIILYTIVINSGKGSEYQCSFTVVLRDNCPLLNLAFSGSVILLKDVELIHGKKFWWAYSVLEMGHYFRHSTDSLAWVKNPFTQASICSVQKYREDMVRIIWIVYEKLVDWPLSNKNMCQKCFLAVLELSIAWIWNRKIVRRRGKVNSIIQIQVSALQFKFKWFQTWIFIAVMSTLEDQGQTMT